MGYRSIGVTLKNTAFPALRIFQGVRPLKVISSSNRLRRKRRSNFVIAGLESLKIDTFNTGSV